MQHDIKKVKENLSDAQIAERTAAAETFRDILQSAFNVRQEWHELTEEQRSAATQDQIKENISKTDEILQKNPDCYSIFAFRREMFILLKEKMFPGFVEKAKKAQQQEQEKEEEKEQAETEKKEEKDEKKEQEEDSNEKTAKQLQQLQEQYALYFSKEVLLPELMMNTEIVKKDHKSYAAWVHRRWVLNTMHSKVKIAVLKEENAKIEQLLARDERNFHAWGYRRWVTSELKGVGMYSDDQELLFSTSKIGSNFSNYSAWHNRALVLWDRLKQVAGQNDDNKSSNDEQAENNNDENTTASTKKKILDQISQDQGMLVQAFYCDPNDQSAFVYCKNFVAKIHHEASTQQDFLKEVNDGLQKAIQEACEELRDEEKNCSWPRYMLMCLPNYVSTLDKEQKKSAWDELMKLDPTRKCYYEHEIQKLQ